MIHAVTFDFENSGLSAFDFCHAVGIWRDDRVRRARGAAVRAGPVDPPSGWIVRVSGSPDPTTRRPQSVSERARNAVDGAAGPISRQAKQSRMMGKFAPPLTVRSARTRARSTPS
jgi:hypothetical protein